MSTKLTVSVGMFRAIHTKYIGPSNTRGSRIKAFDEAGNSVTIGYDDDVKRDEPYAEACRKLCEKMGWTGRLVGGGTKGGYTFVFVEDAQ